jgi:hypothetical protein
MELDFETIRFNALVPLSEVDIRGDRLRSGKPCMLPKRGERITFEL